MKLEYSIKLNLWAFFIATFLVFINFYTSFTVLPLYIEDMGGTEFQTGIQSTVFLFAAVLLRLYFGPMADSKGRKIPLFIGAFAFGTAPLLFLVSKNIWILTLTRVYQAIGLASYFSSASSYISDVAPVGKLGTYIGLHRLIITLALLIGSPFSIFIINNSNYETWFLVSFFIGLLSIGLILLLKIPTIPDIPKTNFNSFQYVDAVLKNENLKIIFTGIALVSICYGSLLTFATVFIARATQIANPGMYFTYFAIASIIANFGAGYISDLYGRQIVIWPAVSLLGLGTASLFFLTSSTSIFFFSSIASGLGFAASILVLIAWLVDSVDNRLKATAISIQESTIDLSCALGSLIIGIISKTIGLHLSFAYIGLLVFLVAIVLLLKAIRNLST